MRRAGANTRTTQLFINMKDNREVARRAGFRADREGDHGNGCGGQLLQQLRRHAAARAGAGPVAKSSCRGTSTCEASFPRLDYIKKATIQ